MAQVVHHLCRWLDVPPGNSPAEYHRSQGAEEMIGGWTPDPLSELCKASPLRWEEYVQPGSWV